ncbi:MAG: hypothetical protein JAY90_23560 [Candidatus Thiodiazotropha lotti]|nr:hypothetical protein [Candidatus Thiodiazotropha lotti]
MRKFYYIALVSIIWVGLPADVRAAVWSSSTIHESDYFNLSRNTHVVDDAGNPHIFYGGTHLYHSYQDSNGSWIKEIVDSSPKVGKYAVATKDRGGNYHLLYTDLLTTEAHGSGHVPGIKYAVGVAGDWTIETTPIPSNAFGRTYFGGDKSIAVDSIGNAHFAYFSSGKLYHAVKKDDVWAIEVVKESVNNSSDPGDAMLAIDTDDVVHIGYLSQDTGSIEHAYYNNGVWNIEVVGQAAEKFVTLAVNSENTVYICYPRKNPIAIDFFCSSNAEGVWSHELVDNGYVNPEIDRNAGYSPSIFIDEDDRIHLVFFLSHDSQYRQNSYIRYAKYENSSWKTSAYEFSPEQEAKLSNLSVVANDSIGFFMLDGNSDDGLTPPALNFVSWNEVEWITDQVTTGEREDFEVGYKSDVIVDQSGDTHIVYVSNGDSFIDDLVYAIHRNGNWSIEKLADFPQKSDFVRPAITLDANGFVHIVYAENNFETVGTCYITNSSGTWSKEIVESEFIASGKYSIKVDGNGVTHIAYVSNGNTRRFLPWQLRYANNKSGSWIDSQLYEYNDRRSTDITRSNTADSITELAFDSDNNPRIAFIRLDQLLLASKSQAGWDVSSILDHETRPVYIVDVLYKSGWLYPSIAFDSNLDLHLGYEGIECRGSPMFHECFHAGIQYSKYSSGMWQHYLIDPEIYYIDLYSAYHHPEQPDIAVANDGKVYLVYYHSAYEHMRIAEISDDCLTTSTEIDTELSLWGDISGNIFLDARISIKPDNTLSISYFDNANGALKHAFSNAGLNVGFCVEEQQNGQSLNVELINKSDGLIAVSDIHLISTSLESNLSGNCAGALVNSSASCSISTRTDESIVPTVSGILSSRVSDPVTNESNLVFVSLPEVETNNIDEVAPPNDDSDVNTTNNNGGGGALTFYLLLMLFLSALAQKFIRVYRYRVCNGALYEPK